MMPNPQVASVHHRDARQQAMGGVASTFADPFIAHEMGTYDIKEDLRFEIGMKDMLKDFFFVMFCHERMWE